MLKVWKEALGRGSCVYADSNQNDGYVDINIDFYSLPDSGDKTVQDKLRERQTKMVCFEIIICLRDVFVVT